MNKKDEIQLFFHCRKCSEENIARKESMEQFSRISAGWTKKGLQVWCVRHNCNIINLDFMGQKIDFMREDDK